MPLADVHAHLTHPRLRAHAGAIVARARAAGVGTMVTNGLNPADNEAAAALAAAHPEVRAAFGLYPVDAVLPEMLAAGVDYPREDEVCDPEAAIAWLAEHVGDAFAVGEIGLDHHWVPEPFWGLQEDRFRRLVQIGLDAGKALIVHTRKAEARAFDVLVEMGVTRVNWHCFGGKVKLGRRIAEHGHWLSIPAIAPRSESFTRLLQTAPRERILLETDCPYLPFERGVDNEPAAVAGTAAYVAQLWEWPVERVEEQLAANFEALFGVRP